MTRGSKPAIAAAAAAFARAARYIGAFPCQVCKAADRRRMVRVYDVLPDCVLCASCTREINRQESMMEGGNDGNDD